MTFNENYELVLCELRNKAIKVIENYEGNTDFKNKDYYQKLNFLINKNIGNHVKAVTKISIKHSLRILDQNG